MTFKLSKRLILLQNKLCENITGNAHFFWFHDSVIKFTPVRAEMNVLLFPLNASQETTDCAHNLNYL